MAIARALAQTPDFLFSLLIQTDMSGAIAFIMLISIATFAAGFAGAFLLAKNSKE